MMGRRMVVTFVAGFGVFSVWMALRLWDLLIVLDMGIIAVQAVVPLFALALSAIALMRSSTSFPRSMGSLALILLLSYPIWISFWWLSMFVVSLLVEMGVSAELMNNSQMFLSSFVGEIPPAISVAGVMSVIAWITVKRTRAPQDGTSKVMP